MVSSTLPFEALPELVVVHLVMFCLLWLNFFPPSGGISPTLSPEAIVKGRGVDSKLHCRVPFGGYVQVQTPNGPTNNALTSRTVGAIALGPTGNSQGTYKFMSLLTGRLIKGRSFTILPMPSDVQEKVKELATKQPKEMTFGDRDGKTTIHDLSVDEAEDEFSKFQNLNHLYTASFTPWFLPAQGWIADFYVLVLVTSLFYMLFFSKWFPWWR